MTRITRASVGAGAMIIAAVAISFDSAPTLAQDQGAPCSFGSDNVCYHERICTNHGFNFSLWPFQFGWATCLDWHERYLYYQESPETDTSGGSEPDDPGTPPGGE